MTAEPLTAIRKPPERATRHCDGDCLHSKACNAELLERMQDVGLACIDCGKTFVIGEAQYGAGDGHGQLMRCESCHKIEGGLE
jgi:hypothetical protein